MVPASAYTELGQVPPASPPSPPLFFSIHDALAFVTLTRPNCGIIHPAHRITVQLYPTVHYIDHTLHLDARHSSLHLTTMHPSHQRRLLPSSLRHHPRTTQPHRAIISAGLPVTNWTRQSGHLYTATLPPRITGSVTQLFVNDVRVPRSRVPANHSEYLQYEGVLADQEQARYGFQYAEGQFEYSKGVLDELMVVVYHSWTTSHHYVDRLLPSNRTVLFTNPCGNYIGYFGIQANRRYHIENAVDALTPNSFAFVNRTRTLYLLTDGSYEPSQATIVAPVQESVIRLAGNDAEHPLHDVLINGIAMRHAAWNIARDQQADNQAASWLPSAALFLANATGVLVTGVEVSHTGQYGVYVREAATGVDILDSVVTDTGAGGVRVGQMQWPVEHPTSGVAVVGNEVSFGGAVFPDGVAIISHRATSVSIVDNHVHHHRYSGVSVGWSWGYQDPSGTEDVLIQGNFIHDIGQHLLNDQVRHAHTLRTHTTHLHAAGCPGAPHTSAAPVTLTCAVAAAGGRHDTGRHLPAGHPEGHADPRQRHRQRVLVRVLHVGHLPRRGLVRGRRRQQRRLRSHTTHLTCPSRVTRVIHHLLLSRSPLPPCLSVCGVETGWASLFLHYGANNSVQNNVFARASSTERPYPGNATPDGMVHITQGEPHISWTFAHNIVYDISPQQNHSAFASQLGVIAPMNDNVYFNTRQAQMLFGAPPVPFAQWQRAGHDANSVIADPLFASDVSQCDFFSLRADSPAAQRGFVNLTKPSMWTPGCITDDIGAQEGQFYHWRT